MAPETIGALPPMRMQAPRSFPGRSAFGITLMQCMQRAQSLLSICQGLAVPRHALRRAAIADVTAHVDSGGGVRADLVLVHLDRVTPGADDAEVGAGDRSDAVVRTARRLDLELVGQRRAMDLVLVVLGDVVASAPGCRSRPTRSAPARRSSSACAPPTRNRRDRTRPRSVRRMPVRATSVFVPSRMMSPVAPCRLVSPEPCFSQMSHTVRSASVV